MTMEAKGWPGRKFYLSNEAFALLKAHCEGTPLTMSAYLDGLIKAQLDSPAERFLRGEDLTAREREQRREEKEMLLGPEPAVEAARELLAPPPAPRNPKIVIEPKQPAKKDFKIDL